MPCADETLVVVFHTCCIIPISILRGHYSPFQPSNYNTISYCITNCNKENITWFFQAHLLAVLPEKQLCSIHIFHYKLGLAMLIEIVESPLTEYYLQRVMQERQMKKMQTCKKIKVISAVFNFIQPIHYRFLGETWLLNVMIIIQETHRLHVRYLNVSDPETLNLIAGESI